MIKNGTKLNEKEKIYIEKVKRKKQRKKSIKNFEYENKTKKHMKR